MTVFVNGGVDLVPCSAAGSQNVGLHLPIGHSADICTRRPVLCSAVEEDIPGVCVPTAVHCSNQEPRFQPIFLPIGESCRRESVCYVH